MRGERCASKPAHYVPAALQAAGLEIVPVPVYERAATQMLGQPVYRRLADIPGASDLVDVFRRPQDLSQQIDDMLAAQPRAVWFQSGIRNQAVAESLARAGIKVVQDRCPMTDYLQLRRQQGTSSAISPYRPKS